MTPDLTQSAPKFTPGPWKLEAGELWDGEHHLLALLARYAPESDANASLVLRAPDLYAALEALCDAVDRQPGGIEMAIVPQLSTARQVLAAARGEPECSICRRRHGPEVVHECE